MVRTIPILSVYFSSFQVDLKSSKTTMCSTAW